MLLYRVFPYAPDARAGKPGHPLFVPSPQGRNRIDNPEHFNAWYFGLSEVAAVGESFGDMAIWFADMFTVPSMPDASRCVGVYETAEDAVLLDLDDAAVLAQLGIRPSQVVTRDRATTQSWALNAYQERVAHRIGVTWWSFHWPEWKVAGIWQPLDALPPFRLVEVRPIDLDSPTVVEAAGVLNRPLRR